MNEPTINAIPQSNKYPRGGWLPVACAVFLGIAALSVAYYFAIALPRNNAARLALERERFEADRKEKKRQADEEQLARERQEADKTAAELKYTRCEQEGDDAYWSYVKLNGNPVEGKPNTYSASQSTWEEAAKRKERTINYCLHRF